MRAYLIFYGVVLVQYLQFNLWRTRRSRPTT